MRGFCFLIAAATLAIAADERALRDFVHSSTPAVPRHVEGCSETDITIGSVVEGALTVTDCSLRLFDPGARIGLRTDAYKLVVEKNLIVQVRIESEEFEPDVFLLDSAGDLLVSDTSGEIDKQATATIHLPAGTYTLLASAVTGTGAYRISVQGDAPRNCAAEVLTAGQEVTGSFSDNDCRLVDLAPFQTQTVLIDFYEVMVKDRKALSLKYSSPSVPAALAIASEDAAFIASSDTADLDTSVLASVKPATYLVYVASVDANSGAYKVIVDLEDLRACSFGAIHAGEIANGELTSADCRDLDVFVPGSDASPTDPWKFDLKDRSLVTLTLRSGEFDTYLRLTNKDNEAMSSNDDFEVSPSTDSQIKMSLNSGEYNAFVSRYEGAGAYAFSFKSERLRVCDIPALGTGPTTGVITAEDCRSLDLIVPSADSTSADAFRLRVDAKAVYSFDVTSSAFVPAIWLYDKKSALIFSTSGTSASSNGRFTILLTPGEYTVIVSTRDQFGDYTLTTARQNPKICETSGALGLDGSVAGALTFTDCAILDVLPGLASDTKVDVYSLNVAERRTITFSAESESFPSMILVYDEKDALVASALNDRFRKHAEVTSTLPPGNYTVALTTLMRLTGPYTALPHIRCSLGRTRRDVGQNGENSSAEQ